MITRPVAQLLQASMGIGRDLPGDQDALPPSGGVQEHVNEPVHLQQHVALVHPLSERPAENAGSLSGRVHTRAVDEPWPEPDSALTTASSGAVRTRQGRSSWLRRMFDRLSRFRSEIRTSSGVLQPSRSPVHPLPEVGRETGHGHAGFVEQFHQVLVGQGDLVRTAVRCPPPCPR